MLLHLKLNPFNQLQTKALYYAFCSFLVLSLGFTPIWTAHSATTDFNAPIKISADRAEQNEKTGLTVYHGNVSIQQASISITANEVSIKTENPTHEKRQIKTIIAKGNPAHFTQTVSGTQKRIEASGNTIYYDIETGEILLEEQAVISQQGSKVSGESIKYSIIEQLVRAEASATNESTRVETIILPDTINSSTDN